ncbi:MAG TPA: YihY/virulence factor BrkB family protein [Planctomycetota bacterium]|jgi:membrane protein
MSKLWRVINQTFNEWNNDNAPRLGAALAFYAAFSIAPLLVLAIAVSAFVVGPQAAHGQVSSTLRDVMGDNAAQTIESMISAASHQSRHGVVATVISIIVLIFGASGLFIELQNSLNTIWGVPAAPGRGWVAWLKSRLFSIFLVLLTGVLVLASLALSVVLSAIGGFVGSTLPGGAALWEIAQNLVLFGVVWLLFSLLYKYVPDARIDWRDVRVGAGVTAALFVIGKSLLGLYLGRSSVASSYGAAGSIAVVLLWIYYVTQIFFLGAEFTQVYANTYGSKLRPATDAEEPAPEAHTARAQSRRKPVPSPQPPTRFKHPKLG